jgi:uncharacterized membrane protein
MIDKTRTDKAVVEVAKTQHRVQDGLPQQQKSNSEETLGQRLADSMTAKIGSWAFLTVQSGILAGWITLNSIPGVPHWDNNPFILLNLVFSFASAYTAPIVLMSQSRQSEQDRKIAEADHRVNIKAGQDVELLHTKIDALQEELVKKQQQRLKEIQQHQQYLKETQMSVLMPLLNVQQKEIQVSELSPSLNVQQNDKFPKKLSEPKSSNINKSTEDSSAVVEHLFG